MTNFQVYKKTLLFSVIDFFVGLFALAILAGSMTAGYFIANTSSDRALIGLVVGFVIGLVPVIAISYLVNNRIKAAQIAMMVKGIHEGDLPDHTFSEGFKEIKGRFGKITLFFFVTNIIKGIFNQLGRGITRFGNAVGGQVGGSIGSAVDSAIQTLVSYLCDCCLAWIIFRKEESVTKAGCEGAVIFFKHGKTLIRNVGRIFGMGFLSLILIGGAFFGAGYGICSLFPQAFESLAAEVSEIAVRSGEEVPEFFQNPTTFMLFIVGIGALVLWGMVHAMAIRPFILVGVMRNFLEAGQKDMPTEQDFAELDKMSPKFAKLHNKI